MKHISCLGLCLVLTLSLYAFKSMSPFNHRTLTQKMDDSLILSRKYFHAINSKMEVASKNLGRQTEKMIARWKKKEQKLSDLIAKTDPDKAKDLFGSSQSKLDELRSKIKNEVPSFGCSGEVPDYLDSLSNTLKFLKDANLSGQQASILNSIDKEGILRQKFSDAGNIQRYIQEREQLYASALGGISQYARSLKRLQAEAYYYNARIAAYKETLHDPKKAEAKVLEVLRKSSFYQSFMQKNSQLAGVFNFPAEINSNRSIEGLQLRDDINQAMVQQMGSSGAASGIINERLNEAQARFNEYRSKFPSLDNAAQMPDFKPNPMKTLSFWQRLEPGGNIQISPSSRYFPALAEIAAQIAYRFSVKGSIGLGIAYKLGLGSGWDHIAFSNQGAGLRAFIDYKLINSYYINGGYEGNRNIPFNNFDELKVKDLWQRSALIGVAKKFKVNDKLKGSILLLYDFLAPTYLPLTQRLKVRYGYNF